MKVFMQSQNYWGLQAKAVAGDSNGYDAFSAAADKSRAGMVTKLVKPDGQVITYHNGHCVAKDALKNIRAA